MRQENQTAVQPVEKSTGITNVTDPKNLNHDQTVTLLIKSDTNSSDPKITQPESSSTKPKTARDQEKKPELPLTNKEALITTAKTFRPIFISRISGLIYNIATGYVIANLDESAKTAAPVFITIQYALLGSSRISLSSLSILIAEASKQGKDAKYLGALLRQSWAISAAASLFLLTPILMTAHLIVNQLGSSDEVANSVKAYFWPMCTGLIPTLMTTADAQFAIGLKQSRMIVFMGSVPWLLSAIFSYPLAFSNANYFSGVYGLGWGVSLSSWALIMGLQYFYRRNKDYEKYHLFQNNQWFPKLKEQLQLCYPVALQALSEWGNLLIISVISASISDASLTAQLASQQLITIVTFLLLGFNNTTNVLVGGKVGSIKKSLEEINDEEAQRHHQDLIKLGNAGIILGTLGITVISIFIMIFRQQFTQFFTDEDKANTAIFDESNLLLIINSFGLIADAVRNCATGALNGIKQPRYAPVQSFLYMSLLALPIGYGFGVSLNQGLKAIFIIRNIGIMLSAITIIRHWFAQSKNELTNIKQELGIEEKQPPNSNSFFSKEKILNTMKNCCPRSNEEDLELNKLNNKTPLLQAA